MKAWLEEELFPLEMKLWVNYNGAEEGGKLVYRRSSKFLPDRRDGKTPRFSHMCL